MDAEYFNEIQITWERLYALIKKLTMPNVEDVPSKGKTKLKMKRKYYQIDEESLKEVNMHRFLSPCCKKFSVGINFRIRNGILIAMGSCDQCHGQFDYEFDIKFKRASTVFITEVKK